MSGTVPPTQPLPSTPEPARGASSGGAGPSHPQPSAPVGPGGFLPAEGERRGPSRGPLIVALVVAVLLLVGSVGATAAWAHGSSVAQRGVVRTWNGMPGMHQYGRDGDDLPGQGVQPGPRSGFGYGNGYGNGGPGFQRRHAPSSSPSASASPSASPSSSAS